ncbi:hypothetical protein [Anabaena azotica]|uniref:hypothetical protein n=1 Tax=Anabaena azotica TaxID=197653 RepID=UPI0039A72C68
MHNASRWIINYLVEAGIGTLVIGKNEQWKQEINLGKTTNHVNASLNIARKVVPAAFSLGIEEPLRWTGSPA